MTVSLFDGVRIPDFPDLGDVDEFTRLVADKGGAGLHTVGAVLDFLRRNLALDVSRFGAKGDGVTDDTAAIQRAIDAAAVAGATVQFDAKRYRITETLTVGDGSSSAVSTYGGVRLLGRGQPLLPSQFLGGYPPATARGTRLVWAGPRGGTMLAIRGPLQGWGVSDVFFDGTGDEDFGGGAGIGLHVVSAMNGDSRNLTFRGCREASIYSTTVQSPPGVNIADSLHNNFENINIGVGWAPGAKGIVLTGVTPAGNNTDYCRFSNVAIALPTDPVAAPSAYGIYFQSCDSNVFHNVHMFNGHPGCVGVMFDYAVNPDWPAGNQIYGIDWAGMAGPVQIGGTPSANARPNFIYAVNEANGGFMPMGLPNLVTESGVVATRDLVGQTGPLANQSLREVNRTGLYRLNYSLLVTGGGANGGNLALTVSWLDGLGTPSFTTPSVPNGPGNHHTGSVPMRIANFGRVSFSVATPGIGGSVTTQYALMLALERLA